MSSRMLLLVGLLPLLALIYTQLSRVSLWELASRRSVALDPNERPRVIMASTPAFSHMEKITSIAEGLIRLGYPVSFITGPDFKDYIQSIGATYIPIEGRGPGMIPEDQMPTFLSLQGPELEIFSFNTIFSDEIPAQHRTLQRTFEEIREAHGQSQPLIYIADMSFGGLAPVWLGAPGILPDVAISIGVAPYAAASNDTFPFQSGRHPDTSTESKRIHFEAQQERYSTYPDKEWNAYAQKTLKDLGAVKSFPSMFDMFTTGSDIHLQYGVPEFEYPRSDLRPNLKFVGAPVSVGVVDRILPDWWDDVVQAKKAGKHIVAVTQSTVVFDNTALIIPALEAFQDREDVFVVATLVTADVQQLDYQIPTNARVAKFIPLDLVLPHTSILITNGGYGTIQQALAAGVPMIVSGIGQDKTHTGGIINYVGNGIYNPVFHTNSKMLGDAYEEILRNKTYRNTAEAIAKEYKKYNAVQITDATIQQVLRGEYRFER
ncbi:hypothetical protein ACN47E_000809 [Coniothyrium glycines]